MKKQPILGTIQKWLNKTYSGISGFQPIAVSEVPGWETTNAMLVAYQIEEGISSSVISAEISSGEYDFTEQNFVGMTPGTDFSVQSNLNKLMILQGAFYIQGINPGPFGATTYSSEFENAVSTLQTNAGIEATGVADFLVVKGLLSMNSFVVLPQDGGIEPIAEIQRALNADYAGDMGGLIPCDGIYGRELNKALIYAVQIQEGISVPYANKADGYFSPKTQKLCPTLQQGESNNFVTILQYALYCNGYTGVSFTGIYDAATTSAVASFGRSMGIATNGGETANLDLWMGLLLSSGNPNRSVSGCDAAQTLSYSDAQTLKANGYDIVGRYLTEDFATSVEELTNILNAGLNVFPIYETCSNQVSYFSPEQGTSDAIAAAEACRNFGIPEGTRIYFTVDYDMEAYQIENLVIPYFEAICNKFNNAGIQYNIGVYGSRYVCSEVINAGYADLAFVDGASTGYSGNMGFPMPEAWAFNQIKEGVDIDGIQIDNDQVSGAESGFNCLIQGGNTTVINNVLLTGPSNSNNSQNVMNFVENFISFLVENCINLKIEPIKIPGMKRLFIKPEYHLDDMIYIRAELGMKAQLGSGSSVTFYHKAGEDTNIDIIPNGIGINITPIIKDSDFESLMETLIGTMENSMNSAISTGSINIINNLGIQIYPKWPEDEGSEDGYYEMGAEVGLELTYDAIVALTKHFNINLTENEMASLVGLYGYLDVILGIKSNFIIDSIMTTFVSSAAIKIMAKILAALKDNDIVMDPITGTLEAITQVGENLLMAFEDAEELAEAAEIVGAIALCC